MHIPKKYLHDKFVLLLVSINAFSAFLCVALILLRTGIGHGANDYIVQYRANLGLSAFERDSVIPILSFIFFVLATLVINVVLSIRTYQLRRTLSLTILGLGILIMLLSIIVSNALLALS
jgi:hypothetical protein